MAHRQRLWLFLAAYLLAYFAASYLDLATTALGLQRPGATEKNVFATDSAGVYLPTRAWALTLGGAVMMIWCILFAARHSPAVDDRWLRRPMRSYTKHYVNPWSRAALDVSPLHMLSLALAFVVLRLAAAANNLSIHLGGPGPMGELIKWLSGYTSPLVGFVTVAVGSFVLLTVLISPLAARIVTSWRRSTRSAS